MTSGVFTPWPNQNPLWQILLFFTLGKNRKNIAGPPFCMSTSGQRKFGPPLYEILNTPLCMTFGSPSHTVVRQYSQAKLIIDPKYYQIACQEIKKDVMTKFQLCVTVVDEPVLKLVLRSLRQIFQFVDLTIDVRCSFTAASAHQLSTERNQLFQAVILSAKFRTVRL